ncbi:nicotinate-nucleotide diphosphorylase (carboxylating) [Snodgrassella alvi]|uniref:carboxylating nicotinate-nucleotide diphosphorylase n=1 Tax=Snodgrassella alvi TaxID=1196083 RepID=UPI0009FEC0A9|nr:carboxylating nicotinate-nucleotide diphosphorylase [Snodgrassella alvi]ORF07313.1 nicotinate-nucleotide diphosphorylase (carboxylating) [Snodgrassella alvi]ORF16235.1 nicotinate-nucleotide diphosphorylase (carboxylating) [Snodgrassella alvi]ORF19158.1 nicotinate-nucleotide diphosphorylase (carboxylating) [Snodgrassella alvi]ORF20299.1 nicotinate-nucleotide diphosphorylase (carboxylating) [Snodgrassella alvi]
MISDLPEIITRPLVQAALSEDLGRRGDVTSQAVIPADRMAAFSIVTRVPGVVCGLELARQGFALMNENLEFTAYKNDGDVIAAGTVLARVAGNARAILAAERTALNFLTHLSGIATTTHEIQKSIAHTGAQLTCTRKTIPNLRIVQKYAVRMGGGRNHRMGLDDAILIKDNHIALSGGDIITAVKQAKSYAGHLIAVEVEVDTLQQLRQVLDEGVSLVLLDNMSIEEMRTAVSWCKGHCQTEASGNLRPNTVVAAAETGVDFLAMGYLTHSARYLDIGLDYADNQNILKK